jgi:hypothetical protein
MEWSRFTNYEFLYEDFHCLATGSRLASASNIQIDTYTANSIIIAQVQLLFDSGAFKVLPVCVGSIATIVHRLGVHLVREEHLCVAQDHLGVKLLCFTCSWENEQIEGRCSYDQLTCRPTEL